MRRAMTVAAPALAVVLFAGVALPRVEWPGERPETAVAMLTSAVDATEEQGSARIEIEFEFETGSEITSSRSSGVIDFETDRALLEVTFSIGGEERVVETVTEGMRVFERPADSPDAQWREVDIPPGASAGAPDSEPTKILRYIESVASEVINVGTEVRDGVPVTHYRAVLDPTKVYASQDLEAPEGLDVETEPMDVWVDEQGRVREATFAVTVTMDDYTRTMRGSLRFFDFGAPVDIELPEPGDVAPPTPEPDMIEPTTEPDTYVVGSGGLAESHVAVRSRGAGPSPLCVRIPAGKRESAVVVDETSTEELFSAEWSGYEATHGYSYSLACTERMVGHVKVDLLLADPARFTLRVGEGPDQVVVELTEVRGYW